MTLSCADHAARLPPRHADRAQHAELARPLEDGQHERVDHAEQARRSRRARAARRRGSSRRSSQAERALDELVLRLHLRVGERLRAPRSTPSDEDAVDERRGCRPAAGRPRRTPRARPRRGRAAGRTRTARRRRGRRPRPACRTASGSAAVEPTPRPASSASSFANDRAVRAERRPARHPSPASTRSGSRRRSSPGRRR